MLLHKNYITNVNNTENMMALDLFTRVQASVKMEIVAKKLEF